eukprot:TRINITY_DN2562_c0_g2_i1.p1 TRINITY_DN2562_c0_g2~~TRINITY_DN2562_c0_g2_i1.p1  ORF type:complete len:245 (-),score=21.69 TRINITY_DN2562_c0_g2_i1:182-916(-)
MRNFTVKVYNDQKHVVITGGNTGIGFETAKALSKKGYSITLSCRNLYKAENAKYSITSQIPEADIDIVQLKLHNLQNVADVANQLLDSEKQIDVLLNNAGVFACPYQLTDDGIEYQQGVNHFGHFLFTQILLPKLVGNKNGSRIINVTSAAHLNGSMDFNDLMFKKGYNRFLAYYRSKLENVLFTYELARRLRDKPRCTVNCLHPGVIGTEIWKYSLPEFLPFRQQVLDLAISSMKMPQQGAET